VLVKRVIYRRMVDALGPGGDEGRGVPAISCGEVASNLWSADLRMGKPNPETNRDYSETYFGGRTWGSETSQYPEEKKKSL